MSRLRVTVVRERPYGPVMDGSGRKVGLCCHRLSPHPACGDSSADSAQLIKAAPAAGGRGTGAGEHDEQGGPSATRSGSEAATAVRVAGSA